MHNVRTMSSHLEGLCTVGRCYVWVGGRCPLTDMFMYSCEVLCLCVVHSIWVYSLRLWVVCSLCLGVLTPFVGCWEVLWLSDVGEVVVLLS